MVSIENSETDICCLCGKPFVTNPADDGQARTKEHVPAKEFHPKAVRVSSNANLWTVPTHKACNASYREDETYFYHTFYSLVQKYNSEMGGAILRDLKRRASHVETRHLVRGIVNSAQHQTETGILFPPGIVALDLNKPRIDRVILKIAQCLHYREHSKYIPQDRCIDLRRFDSESDVPELYTLLWTGSAMEACLPGVFSYRHLQLDGIFYWSMLFWESFMFCVAFRGDNGAVNNIDEHTSSLRGGERMAIPSFDKA